MKNRETMMYMSLFVPGAAALYFLHMYYMLSTLTPRERTMFHLKLLEESRDPKDKTQFLRSLSSNQLLSIMLMIMAPTMAMVWMVVPATQIGAGISVAYTLINFGIAYSLSLKMYDIMHNPGGRS